MGELGLKPAHVFTTDGDRADPPSAAELLASGGAAAEVTAEKIHVFALAADRPKFPSIRSDDLMAFFGGFGPTYVEWLGDTSCNIHFADELSAKRALVRMGAAASISHHPYPIPFISHPMIHP